MFCFQEDAQLNLFTTSTSTDSLVFCLQKGLLARTTVQQDSGIYVICSIQLASSSLIEETAHIPLHDDDDDDEKRLQIDHGATLATATATTRDGFCCFRFSDSQSKSTINLAASYGAFYWV